MLRQMLASLLVVSSTKWSKLQKYTPTICLDSFQIHNARRTLCCITETMRDQNQSRLFRFISWRNSNRTCTIAFCNVRCTAAHCTYLNAMGRYRRIESKKAKESFFVCWIFSVPRTWNSCAELRNFRFHTGQNKIPYYHRLVCLFVNIIVSVVRFKIYHISHLFCCCLYEHRGNILRGEAPSEIKEN